MVDGYTPTAVLARHHASLRLFGLAVLFLLATGIARAQISDLNSRDLTASIPGLSFGIPHASASGNEFQFFADTGIAESDNITLAHADADKLSQTVSMTDIDLALQEETRNIAAVLKGDFSYLDFLEHAFASQFVGRFDGFASYNFVPEKLWWVLEDNFGQAQLDPFTPLTPLNRQNVNYATTGPRWISYFTPANFLQLDLTASRTQYSVSPFDNDDFFGRVTLGHRQTADSTVAIVVDTDDARFDNTEVNTNFDRENVYVRYVVTGGSRSDVSADLGATAVQSTGITRSDPLLRLSLSRTLSSHSTLVLKAAQELTDASAAFRQLQGGAVGGIVTAPVVLTTSNFLSRYASTDWRYERPLTTIVASARIQVDSYPGVPQSNLKQEGVQVRAERRLSPLLQVGVYGGVARVDYENASYDSTDYTAGASMKMQAGRRIEIQLQVEHIDHSVVGNVTSFKENQGRLTLGYRHSQ